MARWRVLLVLVGAVAVAAASGVAALAAEGPIGAVQRVTPDAFGTPPGGTRSMLDLAQPVMTDEQVETSATGSLHLRFIDESDLWLDANSSLVLDELVFDPATNAGEYIAELGPGLFRAITGALPASVYEYRTPTAVIGVRVTDFAVFVALDGATRVTAYLGQLIVRARAGGKAIVIEPPFTATIAKRNGPVLASPFVSPVYPGFASIADRPLPGFGTGTFGDLSKAGQHGIDPHDSGSGQVGQSDQSSSVVGGAGGSGSGQGSGSGSAGGVGP
jgi:hypothetical protein